MEQNKTIVFIGTHTITRTLLADLKGWDIHFVYNPSKAKTLITGYQPALLVIDPFRIDNENVKKLLPDVRAKGIGVVMYTTTYGEQALQQYDEKDYDLFIGINTLSAKIEEELMTLLQQLQKKHNKK